MLKLILLALSFAAGFECGRQGPLFQFVKSVALAALKRNQPK
jgi:hypothetical protein